MTGEQIRVLIVYHRADRPLKDHFQTHLAVAECFGPVEILVDDRIAAGANRSLAIDSAIAGATVAVLLISAHLLSSQWIQDRIIAPLRARHESRELQIMPLLARPCYWQAVPWLEQIQLFPRAARALSRMRRHDADEELANFVQAISAAQSARRRAG